MTHTYDYPMPALTADVVALSYRPQPDHRARAWHVLLIQRAAEPYLGLWALPGGFVGPNERVEEAASRELAEETGIERTVEPDALVGIFSEPGRDPRGWVVTAAYAVVVASDEVAHAGDDATAVAWVPLADLGRTFVAFDHRAIIEAGLTHFGLFPQGHTRRADIVYDDEGNQMSWNVVPCHCAEPWRHA